MKYEHNLSRRTLIKNVTTYYKSLIDSTSWFLTFFHRTALHFLPLFFSLLHVNPVLPKVAINWLGSH